MSKAVNFLRGELILIGGAVASAVELSLAHGDTVQVALQSAAPLALAAVIRQLHTHQPSTKEAAMADLTALKQAASDLQTAVSAVEAHVAALKAEATPQADVDAVTATVQQTAAQLNAAAV